MHPELFRLSLFGLERPIGSYGTLIVVGAALGIALAVGRARGYGLERFDVLAAGLLGVGGGVAGALGLFALVHWTLPIGPTAGGPGMVFYGGLLGGGLAAWLYCRGYRLPLSPVADAAAPGLALGHAVGRIGCLLGGCCYGRAVAPDFPLALTLGRAGLELTPRHPVQLYEAAALLLLAALLTLLTRRLRPRPGALFLAYVGGYACLRLGTEALRGDDLERGLVLGVCHPSQLLALLALAACAIAGISRYNRRHGRRDAVQLR